MSTTRKKTVGERLVAAYQFIDEPDRSPRALAIAIDAALQVERERTVKIVEASWERLDALNACCAEPMHAVLRAIREGKPPE